MGPQGQGHVVELTARSRWMQDERWMRPAVQADQITARCILVITFYNSEFFMVPRWLPIFFHIVPA